MKAKELKEEAGKKVMADALYFRETKKKSANEDLSRACHDGVSYEVRQPVTVHGDPVKALQYRLKNKIECCVCGITAGTFYFENKEAYCSKHKEVMRMSKEEREEFERSRNVSK